MLIWLIVWHVIFNLPPFMIWVVTSETPKVHVHIKWKMAVGMKKGCEAENQRRQAPWYFKKQENKWVPSRNHWEYVLACEAFKLQNKQNEFLKEGWMYLNMTNWYLNIRENNSRGELIQFIIKWKYSMPRKYACNKGFPPFPKFNQMG